jgi:CHAP domain
VSAPLSTVHWSADLLHRLGKPVTHENLTALVAWQQAEGGHTNGATYNPLNTTYPRPGDRVFNSAGVRAYRNYESGMRATVFTMRNGRYGPILGALGHGDSAERVARAVAASPWGTGPLLLSCLRQAREHVAEHWHNVRHGSQSSQGSHGAGSHPSGSHHGGGRGHAIRHPVGRGGHRIVLDPDELDRLADAVDHLEDAARSAQHRLAAVRTELHLDTAYAPDTATARWIDGLLTTVEQLLTPFATALGGDEGVLRSTRHKVLLAEAGGPLLSPGQAEQLARALRGKVDPATLTVLEALARGGIARHRRPHGALPSSPGRSHAGGPAHSGASGGRAAAVRSVVRVARSQLGYAEQGWNHTKYGVWYGLDGQPWCAMFVSWVFAHAGHPLPHFQGPRGFAGVRIGAEALARRGLLRQKPRAGDLYLHRGATPAQDHTGIVVKVRANGDFETVEGNHGDAVRLVTHHAGEPSMFGFGRVL